MSSSLCVVRERQAKNDMDFIIEILLQPFTTSVVFHSSANVRHYLMRVWVVSVRTLVSVRPYVCPVPVRPKGANVVDWQWQSRKMTTIADNIGSSDRNLTATCRRAKPNYFVPLSVSVRYSVKMMITPFTRDLFRSEVTYEQNIIFIFMLFFNVLFCLHFVVFRRNEWRW